MRLFKTTLLDQIVPETLEVGTVSLEQLLQEAFIFW
jgi:hypothetical protein